MTAGNTEAMDGACASHEPTAATALGEAADAEKSPFDVSYVEAFTSVLHNLITLFTAPPSSSNPPAEAWVIPSLLLVCSVFDISLTLCVFSLPVVPSFALFPIV